MAATLRIPTSGMVLFSIPEMVARLMPCRCASWRCESPAALRRFLINLGQAWVKAFFELYGVEPDEQRMKFYCLLDKFF